MARQHYIYREQSDGTVKCVKGTPQSRRDPVLDYDGQILKTYYDLECRDGTRFHPSAVKGYGSAESIKNAWKS